MDRAPNSTDTLRARADGSRHSSITAIHTVHSLHARHGGPSRSVTALCDALARQAQHVHLLAGEEASDADYVLPRDENATWDLHRSSLVATFRTRRRAIAAAPPATTIVHDHGLWLPSNVSSAVASRMEGVPLVISTRGMLEPWAVEYRATKKKLAWLAYQRRLVKQAAVLHATAESEADGIRRLGVRGAVAIIPNGVDVGLAPDPPTKCRARPRALFLSRIHPKKGLDMLLHAWAGLRPVGWELVIAGPSEGGHREELERLAVSLGLRGDVRFAGPIKDDEKWTLYASSDLFILPTHSENFGIVVAEAMAAGLPVITTKGAPWSVLESNNCGWWTDISTEAITRALAEATGMGSEARATMGKRGAAYVRENLSWDTVASKMHEVYEWILFGGTRPSTVEVQ